MSKHGPSLIFFLLYFINVSKHDIATQAALVCMYLYGACRGMSEAFGDYVDGYKAATNDIKKLWEAKP